VEIKPFSAAQNLFPKRRTVTHEVPQASILGPPHLITHTNDLPSTIKILLEPIILADDTAAIIFNKDLDFCTFSSL
jgi:hypothetical protein